MAEYNENLIPLFIYLTFKRCRAKFVIIRKRYDVMFNIKYIPAIQRLKNHIITLHFMHNEIKFHDLMSIWVV